MTDILCWSLGLAVLLILLVGLYGSFIITSIPPLPLPYTPKDFGMTWEDVSFTTADGLRLVGWFVAASQPSATTIILQHGMGANIGDILPNTACLHRTGTWNLFYYNFRGHGGSEGRYTSIGPLELRDMEAALKFLKTHKPDACRRIGIFGHSLGASVAIVGAARFPEIVAVASDSAFASLPGTVRRVARAFHGIPYHPFVPLARRFASWRLGVSLDAFSPVEEIGRLAPRPVLLIHGDRDGRIPLADAEALWQAAGEPKERWWAPGADHGDLWTLFPEEYERRLTDFFRRQLQ